MITIQNGRDIRVVSKGLYEDLFKGMGFTPVEDEEIKEEEEVVEEVVDEPTEEILVEQDAIIPEEEAAELSEDEVMTLDGVATIVDEVKEDEPTEEKTQPKRHK